MLSRSRVSGNGVPGHAAVGLPAIPVVLHSIRASLGLDDGPVEVPSRDDEAAWAELERAALRLGVAPMVYEGLVALGAPRRALDRLRAAYLGAVLRAETQVQPTVWRTLEALHGAGIEPIVLKGAALAYTVYSKPAHRGMADLDLLLRCQDLDPARSLLEGMGYLSRAEDPEPDHHSKTQYASEGSLAIELHHRLISKPGPFRIEASGYWSRSQRRPIAGVESVVLSPADALHHVCVHFAHSHQYEWYPLRCLVDIAALTTSKLDQMDWLLFLRIVRQSRTSGSVHWPLTLSAGWLGASVPEWVLAATAPPAPLRRLVRAVAQPAYLLTGREPAGQGADVLYRLLLRLSLYSGCPVGDQLAALLWSLFPPREALGHLAPGFGRSRFEYAAYLARPSRILRGVSALGRLVGNKEM